MRVLVCGGRNYFDLKTTYQILDKIHQERKITCVIQGGARGADSLGRRWANETEVMSYEFQADWDKYGKKAGYIRNKQMLDEGKPDLVIAFPGGRGTAMMVNLAKKAGVEVIEVPYI